MSNEFSTPKLTPADNVKIPGVDGNNDSGYLLSEEVKDYMVGGVYGETEEYSTLETYTVGQRVKNEGDLYRCTTAVAVPEVFDPTKWKKIDLPSLDEGVLNAETDVAAVRGTTDGYKESGKAYAIGDPCIQDNIVYVAKEAIADPAGTFDPTKWDQSDLVTLMLKAKENSDAITSLNTTVTNLGSLAIESKTSGSSLDQISSYLVNNLETLTPVKGRFYQYMVQFTASPSGYVHLQIGSRETGVGYGYAYSMDYVTLYYFTISGGTCYLRKVANA